MKKVWLYGAGKIGVKAYEDMVSYEDEQYQFAGFIDSNKYGQKINGHVVVGLDDVSLGDIVVISVLRPDMIVQMYNEARKRGYSNIFLYQSNKNERKTSFLNDFCLECSDWGDVVLPQAEIHVSDYCNLNCRGCTHYSPIFEKKLPDTEERIHDIELLAQTFSHVVDFYLLGGEPFLNPDIEKYITSAYELLPNTRLHIVTNGLLLPKVSPRVYDTIRKYDVEISVSEYKPTHEMIDVIIDVLHQNNVRYQIRPYDSKQFFNKPLAKNCDMDYEKLCISDGCVNIWNGKIARCPSLMYVHELNKKYGLDLPENGVYSMNGHISGRELKKIMKEKVPLCKHCVKNPIEWSCCGTNPMVTDFVEVE